MRQAQARDQPKIWSRRAFDKHSWFTELVNAAQRSPGRRSPTCPGRVPDPQAEPPHLCHQPFSAILFIRALNLCFVLSCPAVSLASLHLAIYRVKHGSYRALFRLGLSAVGYLPQALRRGGGTKWRASASQRQRLFVPKHIQ